ncbi:dihydrofolate reductase [Paeniglutamicibacter antarcticus]|uniref:Dihydrofolate reductase n=2 Tax=Arthrobacter terrae TaxID=2935737 RepID=A0A931G789_9MICC|nr:dihydrofolate reductase [Arthrobacter terrae]
MIWAQAANGVIGRDGGMPWHLPEDFDHFQRITKGHPVIMGRKTWESLPEKSRPLPGRTNIVITSNPDWAAPGAIRAGDIFSALAATALRPGAGQIWFIGGGTIFLEVLSVGLADTALITCIDADVTGDTYAPDLGPEWKLVSSAPEQGWSTATNGTRYRIETWQHTSSSLF